MYSLCLTADEVRELEADGYIWIKGNNPWVSQGDTVAVREPWFRLRPPHGAYAGWEYRYIRESEARAEPLLFAYLPAVTMPASAIRRYVRIERVGPDGCMCVLDREKSKTPQERERERVKHARIKKYGEI